MADARRKHFYAKPFARADSPLPAEFRNRIVCGDSLAVLAQLPANCIDAVVTSPPYNFGMDYAATDDADEWRQYFAKLHAILDECVRVLKFGGRLIINVQPLYSDYVPTHHMISNHLMQAGLIWKGEILWEKNHYNCKFTSWGSWNSPASPYLKYTWEFVEVFCKGDLKKAGDAALSDLEGDDFKQWTTAKWSIAPEKRMQEIGHPAMFPEELARRLIQLFTFREDVVLDPFNGAGTATLVARRLDRRYLGIDVSPDYCRIAEARIAAEERRRNPPLFAKKNP